MTTTTHIPGATVRYCRASPRTPHAWQSNERSSDVPNPKMIAAALVLATTFAAPPADARESRASNGMGHGPGPCMAVATPTEQALMRHESNGWPTARNPRSSAYGCGQMLRAIRRAHYPAGCPLETVNVACQMAGFRHYYRARYGTAERALRARRAKGWY